MKAYVLYNNQWGGYYTAPGNWNADIDKGRLTKTVRPHRESAEMLLRHRDYYFDSVADKNRAYPRTYLEAAQCSRKYAIPGTYEIIEVFSGKTVAVF